MTLSIYEIPGAPETAGREGSAESMRVLLLLNQWRRGLAFRELQDILALEVKTLQSTLLGLQRRYRVRCEGRGTAALWLLVDGRHFHLISTEHVSNHRTVKESP